MTCHTIKFGSGLLLFLPRGRESKKQLICLCAGKTERERRQAPSAYHDEQL